jgi:hypothetical protein
MVLGYELWGEGHGRPVASTAPAARTLAAYDWLAGTRSGGAEG